MPIRKLVFVSLLGLALPGADAKGILVKFLPSPAEDSIVRYDIYRSEDSAQAGQAIGSITPVAADTLRYPDVGAVKGRAYFYSIKAVNGSGLESDPSDRTQAGLPLLALPDTLRPGSTPGFTRYQLSAPARPLRGAVLALTASDSARFAFHYDSAGGWLEFHASAGRPDTGKVIIKASYFGKFEDRDTVLVIVAGTASALRDFRLPGGATLRVTRSGDGALRLAGLPDRALVEILSLNGARLFQGYLRGPEAGLDFGNGGNNGAGPAGSRYHPGYLTVRDEKGRLLGALPLPCPR